MTTNATDRDFEAEPAAPIPDVGTLQVAAVLDIGDVGQHAQQRLDGGDSAARGGSGPRARGRSSEAVTAANNRTVAGCLPQLVAAHDKLAQLAAAVGITLSIADYGGLRDQATTQQLIAWRDEAVAKGEESYDVAPWGGSYHDYGGAFDADPDTRRELDTLGQLAPEAGLRWGGTWPYPKTDRYHFELPVTLEQLRGMWTRYRVDQVAQRGFPQPGSTDV